MFARVVRSWVDADPARAARTDVAVLHAYLAPTGVAIPDDPGATWPNLVELYHAGVCDVSAAPSRTWLTALGIHIRTMPAAFSTAVGARCRRAAEELAELRAW
jgi:ATP-dependent DNA helicase RecQ